MRVLYLFSTRKKNECKTAEDMKTQDREGTNISRKTDNNEKVTLTEKKVK